ncbi:exodeoxyribonuclease V subunit beta [secondary endosymbiont of Ctenarytaina eucalypti]|uniref:RecBCD enzyme subunit RecB n=1 Tax=secondary endosymbiont of Ctenarytaina eucalypti TaxID=1199245 RepID=J3VSX2_9ENTR|nr:exodeoxyribonuclease V subunit beta [secondary endosymbiont of Ctenarytaina eucalypti]AFP85056.1 DNA helicase/exodeoxyribonuclease V, beta subunit [secondary endosymbiont of Ctenarytaina eucalypti]
MNAESLNPLTLPLQGVRLIEASAGTGKTYTLAVLYLRLLLGLGGEAAYSRPLSVKEILVVTFTEVATEELRCRIRKNIHNLRLACLQGTSEDPLLSSLLAQINDFRLAACYLLAAERQIDEAAIHTIHGFCQRILHHYAMESGMFFQQTLIEDESFLRQQVSDDFWRRHCYLLPLDIARIVQKYWEGPEQLLAELLPYLQGEMPVFPNPPDITEPIIARHARIIAAIDALKQKWRESSVALREIFDNYTLNHLISNKKNLSTWLEKIDFWASNSTIDYQVPDELANFKISALGKIITDGEPPKHELFFAIEAFFQQKLSLRELIFVMALVEIRRSLEEEKKQRAEIGFDDLLSLLDRTLSAGDSALCKSLRTRYPVAIIDEFQDTDPQQYRIFRQIYSSHITCALLLIGDPKQAIYAFRGADIFTYMRARSEVDAYYTLDTNWRSSAGMINAVNQLFQNLYMPFIFSAIPFFSVRSVDRNTGLRLVVQQQSQPALRIWLQSGGAVSIREYQECMAHQCAVTIREWLDAARLGKAWLEGRQGNQALRASDITVLVRNRNEGTLVRTALAALKIPAVYLSNRDSVFETLEARELQFILQAVLAPENNTWMRLALSTRLLGLNAAALDVLNNDEDRWEKWFEEFSRYRERWKKHGVLPMLRQILINYRLAERLLASERGERRLTDVLHIGELLQEASMKLENEFSLVRWLILQVESPQPQVKNQQLRLESDAHLVQIITVHKSKGLEFPIVFLPFPADFRLNKQPLFHNRASYTACLDLSKDAESLRLAEEERLAEDVRLLYVALTRSIYHCSLGIAPLFRSRRKKTGVSDLHLSALGYLIQQGKACDANVLHKRLAALVRRAGGDIALRKTLKVTGTPLTAAPAPLPVLGARSFPGLQRDPWRVTSYTGLQRYFSPAVMALKQSSRLDVGVRSSGRQQKRLSLTPHTFPRGVLPGLFLHDLFKTLDFNRPVDPKWLNQKLAEQGIEALWLPAITHWLECVIAMPLDGNSLTLAHLGPNRRYSELPFYMSIDATVQARDLDRLCKRHDALSARCLQLAFPPVKGILKGFIDLVFHWQDRYYLLDYKANWLGKDSSAYTQSAIEEAMILHRYDLQYQLYTVALHRFLRHRLVNYEYHRNFGGVYYLFLRGFDAPTLGNSIFYCRPDIALVDGLDNLFIGNKIATDGESLSKSME